MNFTKRVKKEFNRNHLDFEVIAETKNELWFAIWKNDFPKREFIFPKHFDKKLIPPLVKEYSDKYYYNK